MDTVKLAVRVREELGNGPSGRLRAAGQVPGVTYGKGTGGTPISIEFEDLKTALSHGHNVVLELDFGGAKKAGKGAAKKAETKFAVVKEIQMHPTRRQVVHIDLYEVDLAVEIEAPVPIELVGTPAGVTEGGVLDWEHREVMMRALPSDIPQVLQIDVSDLAIGHHVSVGALVAPEGTTIVDDPETVIAAVLVPRVEVEEAVEEAAEAPAEPEVIGGAKTQE